MTQTSEIQETQSYNVFVANTVFAYSSSEQLHNP